MAWTTWIVIKGLQVSGDHVAISVASGTNTSQLAFQYYGSVGMRQPHANMGNHRQDNKKGNPEVFCPIMMVQVFCQRRNPKQCTTITAKVTSHFGICDG